MFAKKLREYKKMYHQVLGNGLKLGYIEMPYFGFLEKNRSETMTSEATIPCSKKFKKWVDDQKKPKKNGRKKFETYEQVLKRLCKFKGEKEGKK